jgi:histidyl-tRNA synthetase
MEIVELPKSSRDGYYIGVLEDEALDLALLIARSLRKSSKVDIEYSKKSLKSHLKSADRLNAKYALIIGEDELANQEVWLKDLESKEEKRVKIEEIL